MEKKEFVWCDPGQLRDSGLLCMIGGITRSNETCAYGWCGTEESLEEGEFHMGAPA